MIAHGAKAGDRSCYALATRTFDDPLVCAKTTSNARIDRDVSRLIVTDDLQLRIRSALAALVQ
jgi:hypothetical protein